MEVTGTVTRVVHRRASYGSVYLAVTLARPGSRDITLKYLHTFEAEPAKGQTVTIEGTAMMLSPQRGRPVTPNIGAVHVTIHTEQEITP